jgi:hypothetical protein
MSWSFFCVAGTFFHLLVPLGSRMRVDRAIALLGSLMPHQVGLPSWAAEGNCACTLPLNLSIKLIAFSCFAL